MKNLFTLALLLFSLSILNAGEIDKTTAEKVAKNFFYERINQFSATDYDAVKTSEVIQLTIEGEPMLFAVNMSNAGYVLVSSHDKVRPVAGYSLTGRFTGEGLPPQLAELIEIYKLQVNEAVESNAYTNEEIANMWEHLLTDNPDNLKPLKAEKALEPMLTTSWDQGQYYNEMCPADGGGPGGHCYAGCVATALGQVVNYFRWPETGTGSYTYDCPPYGTLTADFGNTTYEWDEMATSLNKSNLAVALLLHHLGIGCDMVYGPDGSGMYNHRAAYVLRTFFKYSPETVYVYRDSTSMDWDSLIIAHLDRSIPMYYAGWSVPNLYGHAFVLDGYQDGNYYHFNWGWSGSYDGYFYTENLNPGGSNFNLAQELIINAYPDTISYSYPYYCQGENILDGTDGTIDDGSGPVNDYMPDASCSWLIAPEDSVNNITLQFLGFNTASGDILNVYDGETTSAPLLGSFQGTELPGEITSTGEKMLITFISDASGNAPGWLLSYEAEIPVYCNGMTNMFEQSGTFSDGSGPQDYHNGSTCLWMINPPGASELTLSFNSFHTEEEFDVVKIYNPVNSELLAEYSGDIIADPVTSPSGQMFITFSTNYTITAPGWEVEYVTDLVNVEENLLETSVEIFPNPATDHVSVSFLSENIELLDISVSEMNGKLVHSLTTQVNVGRNMINMNLGGLETGIYLVKLTSTGQAVYKKLILK